MSRLRWLSWRLLATARPIKSAPHRAVSGVLTKLAEMSNWWSRKLKGGSCLTGNRRATTTRSTAGGDRGPICDFDHFETRITFLSEDDVAVLPAEIIVRKDEMVIDIPKNRATGHFLVVGEHLAHYWAGKNTR